MKTKWLILTMIALFVPSTALAGWVLTGKDAEDESGQPETTFIQDGKIAVGPSAEAIQTVFDAKNGQMMIVNHERKTYWRGDPKEMKAGMNSAMDQAMAEELKDMPPEQAAQYKAMMQGMKDKMIGQANKGPRPKVTIKNAGSGGKIAGYDTVKYQIAENGQPAAEIWLATDLDLSDDFEPSAMLNMVDAMSPEPSYTADPAVIDLYKKGFPLKVVEFDQGVAHVAELKDKVEEKSLPAALFEPPAGFQKTDFMAVCQ